MTLQGGVFYRVYSRVEAFLQKGAEAGSAVNTAKSTTTPIAQYLPELLMFGSKGETVEVYIISLGDSGLAYFTPMTEVALP